MAEGVELGIVANASAIVATPAKPIKRPVNGPVCETCPHWDRHPILDTADDAGGFCRRFPPLADLGWPVTRAASDWCGEHPRRAEPGRTKIQDTADADAISHARAERYRRMDLPGPPPEVLARMVNGAICLPEPEVKHA